MKINKEEKDYTDMGYNTFLERPLLKPKAEVSFSAVDFDSALEQRAITEQLIDESLIDRLES